MKLRYFLPIAIAFAVFGMSLLEMEVFYLLKLYPSMNLMSIPMAIGFYVFILTTAVFFFLKFMKFVEKKFHP